MDSPRKYTGIAVAMRDPGGTLSEPIQVAGADAGGVRYPALAIDPAGDALLAYNSATATGPPQHARRDLDRPSRAPAARSRRRRSSTMRPSTAPAVAIGSDGSGIVAWTHSRRVYVVSVATDGSIGKVKSFASPTGVGSLVAAAGSDGAATRRVGEPSCRRGPYAAQPLLRARAEPCGRARLRRRSRSSRPRRSTSREIRIAADEDGRSTLAWTEDHYGRAPSVGDNAQLERRPLRHGKGRRAVLRSARGRRASHATT